METIRNMGLPLKMNPFQQKQNPLIPNLPQILQLPRKPGSSRTTTDMAIDIGSKGAITKSFYHPKIFILFARLFDLQSCYLCRTIKHSYYKEVTTMKYAMKWKKTALIMMSGILLSSSSAAVPVLAHGHHSSHHSSSCVSTGNTGHHNNNCTTTKSSKKKSTKKTYCAYHKKYHTKKSSCKKYCTVHKKTHKNGRKHHAAKCV